MPGKRPEWLSTTVNAVRELMLKRIVGAADKDAKRDAEMALSALDLLWEQLEGEEAMLAREHERFATLFEHFPDACLLTDAGGTIREVNRAAEELLQCAAPALRGRSLSNLVSDAERTPFLTRLVNLIEQPRAAAWTTQLPSREGKPLGVHVAVRPIPLPGGAPGGLCWVLRRDA